ncbi:UNKNOWN [Stylonychia lemnae]|uniref:Uncharacterized protein n=1 Tax=Stylonychia lemnae TaxID=5949 RepID=A0A078AEH8_STYLE|nr:UNKNOWN [Stylonychia lemnae]|eukprot:CDW80620.1 UNKNOWN [Stylonychia lemnae]
MRSSSQPPVTQSASNQFSKVLNERLSKQDQWQRNYKNLPLIRENSQDYRELCEGIIPQEEFFVTQLMDITEQFKGHHMTKMIRELKQDKAILQQKLEEYKTKLEQMEDKYRGVDEKMLKLTQDAEKLTQMNQNQKKLIDDYQKTNENISIKIREGVANMMSKSANTSPMNSPTLNTSDEQSQKINNGIKLGLSSLLSKKNPLDNVEEETKLEIIKEEDEAAQETPRAQKIVRNKTRTKSSAGNDALMRQTTEKKQVTIEEQKEQATSPLKTQQQSPQNQQKLLESKISELEEEIIQLQNEQRLHDKTVEDLRSKNLLLRKDLDEEYEQNGKLKVSQQEQTQAHRLMQDKWEKDMLELEENFNKRLREHQQIQNSNKDDVNQELIEQIQKQDIFYNDLFHHYQQLQNDWRSMENHIRGVNLNQSQIEQKYSLLLEQFQQVILEYSHDEVIHKSQQEQEEIYQKMLAQKDDQIRSLEEEDRRKDKLIEQLQVKIEENQKNQQQDIENLKLIKKQTEQMEGKFSKQIQERDTQIQSLQYQLLNQSRLNTSPGQLKDSESYQLQKKDKEIQELIKTKDLNQKLIIQLEKQLKDSEAKLNKLKSQSQEQSKRDIENLQKVSQQQLSELDELHKARQQDQRELQQLRQSNHQLEADIKAVMDQLEQQIQSKNQISQQQQDDYDEEQFNSDMQELDFYLNEMREVKSRIQLNCIETKAAILNQRLTNRQLEDFGIGSIQVQFKDSIKTTIIMLKDVIRQELEHLIVLNSQTIEIQEISQDQQSQLAIQQEQQKTAVKKQSPSKNHQALPVNQQTFNTQSNEDAIKELEEKIFNRLIRLVEDDSVQILSTDELLDQVTFNFQRLLQENNDLIKIQTLNNQNLDYENIANEYQQLVDENQSLREKVRVLQNELSLKIREMEIRMLDQQKSDRDQNMKLVEEVNEVQQKNKMLQDQITDILHKYQIIDQQYQNQFKENNQLQRMLESYQHQITASMASDKTPSIKDQKSKQSLERKHNTEENISKHDGQLGSSSIKLSSNNLQTNSTQYNNMISSTADRERYFSPSDKSSNNNMSIKNFDEKEDNELLRSKSTISKGTVQSKNNPHNNIVHQNYKNQAKTLAPSIHRYNYSQNNNNIIKAKSHKFNHREEENDKLNKLIDEYRKENEKCAMKIQDLQLKLHTTSNKFQAEKDKKESLIKSQISSKKSQNSFDLGSYKPAGSSLSYEQQFSDCSNQRAQVRDNYQKLQNPHQLHQLNTLQYLAYQDNQFPQSHGVTPSANNQKIQEQMVQQMGNSQRPVNSHFYSPRETINQPLNQPNAQQMSSLRHGFMANNMNPVIDQSYYGLSKKLQAYNNEQKSGPKHETRNSLSNQNSYEINNMKLGNGSNVNNNQLDDGISDRLQKRPSLGGSKSKKSSGYSNNKGLYY